MTDPSASEWFDGFNAIFDVLAAEPKIPESALELCRKIGELDPSRLRSSPRYAAETVGPLIASTPDYGEVCLTLGVFEDLERRHQEAGSRLAARVLGNVCDLLRFRRNALHRAIVAGGVDAVELETADLKIHSRSALEGVAPSRL